MISGLSFLLLFKMLCVMTKMNVLAIIQILAFAKSAPQKGVNLIQVKFHLDEESANRILLLSKKSDNITERDVLKSHINNILEDINKSIRSYNVQVIGDYTTLLLEELPNLLPKKLVCESEMVASVVARDVHSKMSQKHLGGIGLRLVVISCIVFPTMQTPFFTIPSYNCGTTAVVFSVDPFVMKYQIKHAVKYLIAGSIASFMPMSSSWFKSDLQSFAHRCARDNPVIGKFIPNLVKIEMLSS